MDESQNSPRQPKLIVVGLGLIGGSLIPFLARMLGVEEVMLIDMDTYERPNLAGQLISEEEIGKPKVLVQAERLRRLNRSLRVVPVLDRVENVPLTALRGLVLGCLDSRLARQSLAQMCWRMNAPLIDAGIEPGGLLARIEVYLPGADGGACLECAWSTADYRAAALEQTYPCGAAQSGAAATHSSAALGALAASLQALECEKFLAGRLDRVAVSKQVLIDAASHKHYVTALKRNARCRFDHQVWEVRKLVCAPEEFTLGEALGLAAGAAAGGAGAARLRVEGSRCVSELTCTCGTHRFLLRLRGRLSRADRTCVRCGEEIPAAGMELLEELQLDALPAKAAGAPLSALGLGHGDVFTISGPGGEAHYEICDSDAPGGT